MVSHEAMIRTEMGGGTYISRDMGPGGGSYISKDMGPSGPMSLGKWGRGGGGGGHFSTTPACAHVCTSTVHVVSSKLSEPYLITLIHL